MAGAWRGYRGLDTLEGDSLLQRKDWSMLSYSYIAIRAGEKDIGCDIYLNPGSKYWTPGQAI